LDVAAHDVGERRVVLLEGPGAEQAARPEGLERLDRDLVRRPGRRRGRRHLRAPTQPQDGGDDQDRERQGAAEEVVRPRIDRYRLGSLDVADVGRVGRLREQALDRLAELLPRRLGQHLARPAVVHRRRADQVLAGAVADQRVPAAHDAPSVLLGGGGDPEVDDVEVADAVARLLHEHLDVGRGLDLDRVTETRADRDGLRVDRDADLDGRPARVVCLGRTRDSACEDGEEEHVPAAPHYHARGHARCSRMRKNRRRGSVYGRSVRTTIASTSAERSMRSRSTRAAAARSAKALRTRASLVSTTYRVPVSASSSSTSPTAGSVSSRGSSSATATRSCRLAATRRARRQAGSRRSEIRKTTQRRFVTLPRCSSAAEMLVPWPWGRIDRTSRMTRSTWCVPLRGWSASATRAVKTRRQAL